MPGAEKAFCSISREALPPLCILHCNSLPAQVCGQKQPSAFLQCDEGLTHEHYGAAIGYSKPAEDSPLEQALLGKLPLLHDMT